MKIKKINNGALTSFWIMSSLVGILSFNITQDWATAISQGLVAGFAFSFIYIVGYSMGIEEGKGNDKAMEDLKPVLPSEIQKNLNERKASAQMPQFHQWRWYFNRTE